MVSSVDPAITTRCPWARRWRARRSPSVSSSSTRRIGLVEGSALTRGSPGCRRDGRGHPCLFVGPPQRLQLDPKVGGQRSHDRDHGLGQAQATHGGSVSATGRDQTDSARQELRLTVDGRLDLVVVGHDTIVVLGSKSTSVASHEIRSRTPQDGSAVNRGRSCTPRRVRRRSTRGSSRSGLPLRACDGSG